MPCADLDPLDLPADVRARIRAWFEGDIYRPERPPLEALVDRARGGDAEALDELRDAFSGPLPIGTGGRRGPCGPGPNRINSVVLRQTVWGLVETMRQMGARPRGAVVYDTRRDSRRFAHLVADEAARLGVEMLGLDEPRPTPQLSYLCRREACGSGVVISASHNPPRDNGIKVYDCHGAQVLGAWDAKLMDRIRVQDGRTEPPASAATPGQVRWLTGEELAAADADYHGYVRRQGVLDLDLGAGGLVVVYTPLHGVGHASVLPVLRGRGVEPHPVERQCDPDGGRFSTVRSANPEDPASMDMARALGDEVGAHLVLATDPDADRLGASVRGADGAWHVVDGNRLGVIMLDHVLRHATDPAGWVLTTLVTSPLVGKLARAAGVPVVEDLLVGFKHHAGMIQEQPDRPVVFACEESHGYLRGNEIRDKDGAIAALLLTECAALEHRAGRTLLDRLREIWCRAGYHRERTANLRATGVRGRAAIAAAMEAVRTRLPAAFAGLSVTSRQDRAEGQRTGSPTRDLPGDVVVVHLGDREAGARLVFRPSGTEPKLKVYALAHAGPCSADALDGVAASVDGRVDTILAEARAFAEEAMAPILEAGG